MWIPKSDRRARWDMCVCVCVLRLAAKNTEDTLLFGICRLLVAKTVRMGTPRSKQAGSQNAEKLESVSRTINVCFPWIEDSSENCSEIQED